ncbi:hypothetical protein [Fusobacterium sp. PH5-44]|uniref:hypothetical protein n=1 Tax=Fusobacterium sp. PH5-44 TaxID=2940518 RepID=UPI003D25EC4C
MKTTTLVPQIGKGIYQGVNNKELGQNVLGQLANNLGKNGFNIVAYAYDVDEKLKNIIEDHYINGKYGVGLDEYNMSEIAGLLKPLLAEFGKDFYDIKFVKAEDIASGMSINDKEGVVYINTYGDGFGHSSQMLEQLGHEGMHGTYADKNVDEKAASMLTKIPSKGWSSSIGATAITINAQGMIEASTNQYYKDRANGDLRDAAATAAFIVVTLGSGTLYGLKKSYEKHEDFSVFSTSERIKEFSTDILGGAVVTGTVIILYPLIGAAGSSIAATGTTGATVVSTVKVGGSLVISAGALDNAIKSAYKASEAYGKGHYGAVVLYVVDGTISAGVAAKSAGKATEAFDDLCVMYSSSNKNVNADSSFC